MSAKGDLLAAALDEAIAHLPSEGGREIGRDDDGNMLYELAGDALKFRRLANKHYRDLERSLGNKTPADLYRGD